MTMNAIMVAFILSARTLVHRCSHSISIVSNSLVFRYRFSNQDVISDLNDQRIYKALLRLCVDVKEHPACLLHLVLRGGLGKVFGVEEISALPLVGQFHEGFRM